MSNEPSPDADVDPPESVAGGEPVHRRMRVAAAVLFVHAVAEVIWTIRLMSIVDSDSQMLAAAVGASAVIGLAALAWLVYHGRARTVAAVVEVAIVGGSADWLIVFPRLRIETAATMAIGAVALVFLADRPTWSRSGQSQDS